MVKALLTPEEDKAWVYAFNYWLDEGDTEEEADIHAWEEMQQVFPRLAEFDGCLPDTATG